MVLFVFQGVKYEQRKSNFSVRLSYVAELNGGGRVLAVPWGIENLHIT